LKKIVFLRFLFGKKVESPPPPDDGVHHIAQSHESLYAGNIRYKHQSMVNASASVGVAVSDEASDRKLHVSNDLVIEAGSSGRFTLSLNQAPIVEVKAWYPDLMIDGVEISPQDYVHFTPEDWGPKVVTVSHTGSVESTSKILFTTSGEIKQSIERTITVTEKYTPPQVSVSGDLSLRSRDTQTITISLDQAPGAEVVRLSTEIGGAVRAFDSIHPKTPFTKP